MNKVTMLAVLFVLVIGIFTFVTYTLPDSFLSGNASSMNGVHKVSDTAVGKGIIYFKTVKGETND